MKPINLFVILFLSFFAMGWTGCTDKDEIKEPLPLSFEKDSYEVPMNIRHTIGIRGGNRDYTLSVENPDVLDASLDLSSEIGMGNILIIGKQNGETTLSVTDNMVNQTVTLRIKVIDSYIAYHIQNSNHPALTDNVWVYLIKNDARDCYFFAGNADKAPNFPSPILLSNGKYEFSVDKSPENNAVYLSLTYASDTDGKFTFATIAPTVHKFDISENESKTFAMLKAMLGVDWNTLSKDTRTNVIPSYYLKMKEVGTEYKTIGLLDITPIPENVLE